MIAYGAAASFANLIGIGSYGTLSIPFGPPAPHRGRDTPGVVLYKGRKGLAARTCGDSCSHGLAGCWSESVILCNLVEHVS